jgi:site-specific DNA recombinase
MWLCLLRQDDPTIGAGRQLKDFIYYRCSGSDTYRFGGERICSNSQVQGAFLETTVWREVSNLLMNPEKIELEHEEHSKAGALAGNLDALKSQRNKLDHAMERLIDSFTEGLIEKDQFTSRMTRTKTRITDLDAKIKASAGEVDPLEHLRLATARLRELAAAVGPELAGADWQRRREIIRTLVQRINIDTEVIKIIFRVTQNTRRSDSDSIAITLPRT